MKVQFCSTAMKRKGLVMNRISLCFIIFILSGCASLFPNDQAHTTAAIDAVRSRTKFDMNCDQVDISPLGNVSRLGQQMTSMVLGASGCGKKLSHTTLCVSNMGSITCTPQVDSIQQ